MRNATLRFLALVVAVFLVVGGAPVQAQGTFAHGAVIALQGTPHLWIADDRGILHWGGDTRALSGKHVNWNDRRDVSLAELQTYPIGDPWLSAGLLKDGDPIYQVKWETDWPQPQLLHIQSIKDVELFGINGSNYGNFVIEKSEWERRFGISAAGLQRSALASAVPTIIRLQGEGQFATNPMTLPSPLSVATLTHNGSRNFIVWSYQGSDQDLLVNTIGAYRGERPLAGTEPVVLDIQADGAWSVSIRSLEMGDLSSFSGRGDAVSLTFSPPTTGAWEITHSGDRNFIVWLHCAGGADLIQNEIGTVQGSRVVRFPEGPCFWEVQADGEWSLMPRS